MTFSGLPPSCPPTPHETPALGPVYRVLVGETPDDWDWLSHEKRGQIPPPKADLCGWASVSLFTETSGVKALKNLKHLTHAAKLQIPEGVGVHTIRKAHVPFWCKDGQALAPHVVEVVGL